MKKKKNTIKEHSKRLEALEAEVRRLDFAFWNAQYVAKHRWWHGKIGEAYM